MATKTFYMLDSLADVHQAASETSPGAGETNSAAGLGSTKFNPAIGEFIDFDSGTVRAASAWGATVHPDGSINITAGDCLRTDAAHTGTFAAGNWTFTFRLIGSSAFAFSFEVHVRVFRSANADGSSATEITSSTQQSGAVSVTSAGAVSATITWAAPEIALTAEYLFIQIGAECTVAQVVGTNNAILRVGDDGTRVTTTDFSTPAAFLPRMALLGVG